MSRREEAAGGCRGVEEAAYGQGRCDHVYAHVLGLLGSAAGQRAQKGEIGEGDGGTIDHDVGNPRPSHRLIEDPGGGHVENSPRVQHASTIVDILVRRDLGPPTAVPGGVSCEHCKPLSVRGWHGRPCRGGPPAPTSALALPPHTHAPASGDRCFAAEAPALRFPTLRALPVIPDGPVCGIDAVLRRAEGRSHTGCTRTFRRCGGAAVRRGAVAVVPHPSRPRDGRWRRSPLTGRCSRAVTGGPSAGPAAPTNRVRRRRTLRRECRAGARMERHG